MTFVEKRQEFRPDSGEAPFDLREVFFSRTDARGVIVSGNDVFRRVSNYSWDELTGAPHKIIRHPDMPRAVFWLLWSRLQKGEAIGAYVKNRAKDGLHYWVFAVVAPQGSGFLSARIKPSSPLLDIVDAEYQALRQWERKENPDPEASAQKLLARLSDLGFDSYDKFQSHALAEELTARDKGLVQLTPTRTKALASTLDHSTTLANETNDLIADFDAMRTVPHNLRVIASRMEPTGGPISTLSKNYGAMSRDMFDWFETHVVGEDCNFAHIGASVTNAMFSDGLTRILRACSDQLTYERRQMGHTDIEEERRILADIVLEFERRSNKDLALLRDEANRIRSACSVMERHVLGLSTARVMCKIEGARLLGSGDSLTDIIGQLNSFQDRINDRLDRILRIATDIQDAIS